MLTLLDQRKEAKFQGLQDPSEIKGDTLKNVRCFRNKKTEYMKAKIKKQEHL
jgi:hypothetical protein